LCQLFDTFISSILKYECEIWGFGKNKELERIHLKFCKTLLNVKQSTCTMYIYGESCRYPLYISRHTAKIKYWCKLFNSNNIIIRTLYNDLVEYCNNGNLIGLLV